MQSAILYGLFQPQELVSQQLSFNCPSSSCQWSEFSSLAVCSQCSDIAKEMESSYAIKSKPQYADILPAHPSYPLSNLTQFTLPNGLFINNPNGSNGSYENFLTMATYGTGNSSQTVAFQAYDLLIWSTTILKVANVPGVWPRLPISATECALYYCVKTYKSEVKNGTVYEATILAPYERSAMSWQYEKRILPGGVHLDPNSLEFDALLSAIPRTDLQLGEGFNVSQAAVDSINWYMRNLFTKNTSDYYQIPNGVASNNSTYIPGALQPIYESDDINATFTALATSMSNSIRANSDDRLMVTGQKGVLVTLYVIRWAWLYPPFALVVTGYLVLALAARGTRKAQVPAWKSSSLATISQGQAFQYVLGEAYLTSAMEEKARAEKVQLFTSTTTSDSGRNSIHYITNSVLIHLIQRKNR